MAPNKNRPRLLGADGLNSNLKRLLDYFFFLVAFFFAGAFFFVAFFID